MYMNENEALGTLLKVPNAQRLNTSDRVYLVPSRPSRLLYKFYPGKQYVKKYLIQCGGM